ncbi:hypothetical protein J3R82DRAFT_115 [Butyriboletus roseoflavus]|nr:hypothetical protein J3R82DRAFT_115 [Butyriboletus roseoflavus]
METICKLTAEFVVIKNMLQLLDNNFVQFYAEERVYLKFLKQLPLWDQLAIQYTEVLDKVEQ